MIKIFVFVLHGLIIAAVVMTIEAAQAEPLACGETITSNTVLETNLECVAGDALYIGADGLTLDLNGYAILSPDETGVGIWVDGFDNVTIKNGAIRGFYDGIRADYGANHLRIQNVTLSGQAASSIVIIRSSGVSITDVAISQADVHPDEPTEAIRLANVDFAEVSNTTVEGGVFGVLSIGGDLDGPDHVSTHLKVTGSTFTKVSYGILLIKNTHALIRDNRIVGTDFAGGCFSGIGVLGDPTTRSSFIQNEVTGCELGFISEAYPHSSKLTVSMNRFFANTNGMLLLRVKDSQISHNRVHLNQLAGIELALDSVGNRITSNWVTGNDLADMRHDSGSMPNVWKGNTCVTSDEGIEVDCAD